MSSAAVSTRSSRSSTAITPAAWYSAWSARLGVACAAVCERPARCPAAELPPKTTRSGRVRLNEAASREKVRGSWNDSRYSAAARTSGSSCHADSRSLPDTSALLPSDTKAATPSPRSRAASSRATPTPPDCEPTASVPGAGRTAPKVASSRVPRRLLSSPKQFGPTRRMSCARATAASRCSTAAPLAPVSARPEVSTTHVRASRSASCRTVTSTSSCGTATTARSRPVGRPSTAGTQETPSTDSPARPTAKTVPA
nr:hypothetical protein [Nocardioides panacis]